MNLSPWMYFTLPQQILKTDIVSLKEAWISREKKYCKNIIQPFSLAISLLMIPFFFLDSLRPSFDLTFSLFHRGSTSLLFLAAYIAIKKGIWDKREYSFAYYKFSFILAGVALIVMQQVYMFKQPESPRLYAPMIMATAIFISGIGVKTASAVILFNWITLFTTALVITGKIWNEIVSDVSLLLICSFISVIFTRIYDLQVKLFVANSTEKNAAVERESHALKEMTKLVYPHMAELIKVGNTLEKTMPVGSKKAYALNFDICGSSKVSHELFDATMQSIFEQCHNIMLEGYNSLNMEANAYKVKDMGDGFLCTVGYPFSTPDSKRGSVVSLELADKFIEIFNQEIKDMEYPHEILCSVSICWDTIEGYFPTHGVKQYDVRGKAIILAARYESLRKSLFSTYEDYPGNLITISNNVYNNLPSHLRERFIRVSNKEHNIEIRDDLLANCFYYSAVPSYEKEPILPEVSLKSVG